MTQDDTAPLYVEIEEMVVRAPLFARKSKPKDDRPTAGEVLAELALDKAIDDTLRARLVSHRVRAVVIAVPDAGWVSPVLDAIGEFLDDKLHKIARPTVPSAKERNDPTLAHRLSLGRTVVGVSPEPDRALPELLLSVAECRVTVTPIDGEMLIEAIRRCQGGRVPQRARKLRLELLSFDEITSMIVIGGKAAETVDRLEAAIAAKLRVGTGRMVLPTLEEAIEYGAARQWALDLRDDLADVRRGIIGFDQVDRGAVFHGPPGTGKTLLARMLGEACGIPTVIASMGEFFASTGGYLDNIIKAQRKAFDEARSKSPSILFIDEINALPSADTVGSRNKDYWMPVILDFYQLLDGAMSDREGVIVIGATNRLEDINLALLRPGRLERSIYIGPPEEAGVERITRHHLAGDLAGADLGVLSMVNRSRGATGAIIMEQVRAARRRARRAGRAIAFEDLESQVLADDGRDADELYRAAVHEAGHALVGLLQGTGTLMSVNVMATDISGGGTQFQERSPFFQTRSGFEAHIVMLLAGRAAERLLLGEPSQGAGGLPQSDLGRATHIVASMFASTGLGDTLAFRAPSADALSLMTVDRDLARKVETTLSDLDVRTTILLETNRNVLTAIADALVRERFLTGEAVRKLILERESGGLATGDFGP